MDVIDKYCKRRQNEVQPFIADRDTATRHDGPARRQRCGPRPPSPRDRGRPPIVQRSSMFMEYVTLHTLTIASASHAVVVDSLYGVSFV